MLIHGKDQEEHDQRLRSVLERLKEKQVTLNPQKCEFGKQLLKFLRHIIDHNGVHPDPDKTSAIREMQPPGNITELRRFLGMVNQLGKFSPNLARITQPLRELLKQKQSWIWSDAQTITFTEVKEELTKPIVLSLYDLKADTKIATDASLYGLGAVLLQETTESQWKPVAYASRSMTETERRYAQIEKEALAITWGCEKFSTYVLGRPFLIQTDHKPLIPLLGSKQLDNLPPRVLRFRLRLTRFQYSIEYTPGKTLYVPDTLSRAPLSTTGDSPDSYYQDMDEVMETAVSTLPIDGNRLAMYREKQQVLYSIAKRDGPHINHRLIQLFIHTGNTKEISQLGKVYCYTTIE